MKISYTDIPIQFQIQNMQFQVLHIVYEQFHRMIPAHSHGKNCYEIHYIPYGEGTAVIDKKQYPLTAGTVYVTGPGVEHEQLPDDQNAMAEYCVYFKLKSADGKKADKKNGADDAAYLFKNTSFWFGKDTQDIHRLMQLIFQEMDRRHIGYIQKTTALLTELVISLVRCYTHNLRQTKTASSTTVSEGKQLIAEECFLYEYNTLSLDLLAKRLGLSIRQTERFLRQTYGKTFQQKKKEAKLSAACVLLKTTNLSITEIAYRLGYSSVEHFSHAFSSYFRISASRYRQENKKTAGQTDSSV